MIGAIHKIIGGKCKYMKAAQDSKLKQTRGWSESLTNWTKAGIPFTRLRLRLVPRLFHTSSRLFIIHLRVYMRVYHSSMLIYCLSCIASRSDVRAILAMDEDNIMLSLSNV